MQGSEAHQLSQAAATSERELSEAQATVGAAQEKKKKMVEAAKVGREVAAGGSMGRVGAAAGHSRRLPACSPVAHEKANIEQEHDSRPSLYCTCTSPAFLCLLAVPGARDCQLWAAARQPSEDCPGQDCSCQEGG